MKGARIYVMGWHWTRNTPLVMLCQMLPVSGPPISIATDRSPSRGKDVYTHPPLRAIGVTNIASLIELDATNCTDGHVEIGQSSSEARAMDHTVTDTKKLQMSSMGHGDPRTASSRHQE